ncbi:hypothetical protein HPB50_012441 [Hyalomma asiaticum]|uniref:Uncharacterized protein n=1 Tax=Hyalomma asiaticum TaxID=266040 RepID=A0ACB7S2L5_HYAAI|nr:hypothetical protein HPB50_012441 [Hyalomma asiaticum]
MPAVAMDTTFGGDSITAEELQSAKYTPALYKAYTSRPAKLQQPPRISPTTSDTAITRRCAMPHTQPATTRLPSPAAREARPAVQRSRQLPPLSAIRVMVRPRGELRLRDISASRLWKSTQLKITPSDDLCLRIHPTNDAFIVATAHLPTAKTLETLTSITTGDRSYLCTAYVASPPGGYERDHLERI